MTPCTIAVIVGGTNEPSNSNTLADAFIEGMQTVEGTTCTKIRLKDLHIEHFTLKYYDPATTHGDDFGQIEDAVKNASGVVFATPIWNFSVPAHFKNMIDRMGAFALDQEGHSRGQLNAKPFALIFTGGAPLIAWKALMYLTTLHVAEAIKYYAGTVVYRHFEPKCVAGRGKFGLVVDQRPDTLAAMKKAGAAFAKTAQYYKEKGTLPLKNILVYKWFSFLYRVGNRIMYPISTLQ